jgi:hypothetical protein
MRSTQERINFMRGIDKQIRRKELNMFNLVPQQIWIRRTKEQRTFILTRTKPPKISGIRTYISIITLNLNGFNSPIKRHRSDGWIFKIVPTLCCLQDNTPQNQAVTHTLKVQGYKKLYQAIGNQEKIQNSHSHIQQRRLQAKIS